MKCVQLGYIASMKIENWENVTLGKAEFVEAQARRLLDFTIESLDRIRTEANTCLQWLFGTIAGAAGLAATSIEKKGPWSISISLVVVSLFSAVVAVELIRSVKTVDIWPPGNEPDNLITEEFMEQPENLARLMEAASLQHRIEHNRALNMTLGSSVDLARRRFAYIPMGFFCSILVIELVSRFLPLK